jgi:hypothetical protein
MQIVVAEALGQALVQVLAAGEVAHAIPAVGEVLGGCAARGAGLQRVEPAVGAIKAQRRYLVVAEALDCC